MKGKEWKIMELCKEGKENNESMKGKENKGSMKGKERKIRKEV